MKTILGAGAALLLLASTSPLAANFGDRVEHRLDRRGERIDRQLDRRSDRIEARSDRVASRFGRQWTSKGCDPRRQAG